MKKVKIFLMLVFFVLLMFFGIFSDCSAQYPAYVEGRPKSTAIPYSLPDFGRKTHFWVRDTAEKFFFGGEVEKERHLQFNASYLNKGFFYNPIVSGYKVIKRHRRCLKGENIYFNKKDLVKDPRLSKWWIKTIGCKHDSIWNAIEDSAQTWDYDFWGVTSRILDHMISCGIFTPQEIETEFCEMSYSRIREVMLSYTDIALNHNTQSVLTIIGEDNFNPSNGNHGDLIEFYNWPGYGPWIYPEKIVIFMHLQREKGGYIAIQDEGEKFFIHWHKTPKNEKKFTALRKRE